MRAGEQAAAEHGLGAAYRGVNLGYDGCARYRARLSMDHFPSVVDKAYIVRYERIRVVTRSDMLSSLNLYSEKRAFLYPKMDSDR